MNIAFHTLGCKVNQYETEVMRELFASRGHTCYSSIPADAVIVNSCTVTSESDRKTRQLVRRIRKKNPQAIVVLTGCMAQAFPEKSADISAADIVCGNTDALKTIELTEKFYAEHKRIVNVSAHEPNAFYNTPGISTFSERTRAFMKIEDGCDRFCSYCIIPTARGRVRSRSLKDICGESKRLAKEGFSEIVLVGINLSAYGKNTEYDLCDAVDTVCKTDGIERVRLGSLEPDHISDGMLSRLAAQKKFCPQFHLSLQSGCDETLRRMNRHYDSHFYQDLVTRIRSAFPDASITTDIMVGFPGETDDEFSKSLAFVKSIGFARAHIFSYSPREGTVAAALRQQIPRSIKEQRAQIMSQAVCESEKKFLNSQCGKTYPVLFETFSNNIAEGYTPNYCRVSVTSATELSGKITDVKLLYVENDCCIGEFT